MYVTEETSLKKTIREYLAWKGWFVFYVLQGLGSYPGTCDLIAIKNGVTIYIECKTMKGKQSERQMKFQKDIESHDGIYLLIRTLDDFIEFEKE